MELAPLKSCFYCVIDSDFDTRTNVLPRTTTKVMNKLRRFEKLFKNCAYKTLFTVRR